MKKTVLVVAVHPDDETLGAGGTLLKHKDDGHEINWLIVTSSYDQDMLKSDEEVKKRNRTINSVARQYKFDSVTELNLPTTKLDTLARGEIISLISKEVTRLEPQVIYLPFSNDVHSDHRVVFECAYSCTKSFRYPFVKEVYMMETLSETEQAPANTSASFIPNVFVDISDYLDHKLLILKNYDSEIGEHPFPRSTEGVRALAMYRGLSCNKKYAESFMLLKKIK